MKRILSVILVVILIASFTTGCDDGRYLYEGVDLSKYVTLGQYKGLEVDTNSEEFAEFYSEVILMDVTDNAFYIDNELTEGKVEDGDVANIDYVGKKDGVAFEGGSDTDYDLEIGSGVFMDGFEEGLIGAEIGKSVDIDITFPKDYSTESLAGQKVVFTVKVNSVTRRTIQEPEQYFSKLGFKSVSDYTKDVRERAIQNYLFDIIVLASDIKGYPEDELNKIFEVNRNMLETYYETTFDEYLSVLGLTKQDFINDQIKPMMDTQLVLYAILDKEGMEVTRDEVDEEIEKTLKSLDDSTITKEKLVETYGDFYFEESVVFEKVMDFVYKNAKLK